MKVELERLGRLLQVYLLAVQLAESMIMYLSRVELYTVCVLIRTSCVTVWYAEHLFRPS